MPLGSDPPRGGDDDWTPDDYLRRRARLDVLVRVGFWTTAGSVLLVVPTCLGCAFLVPDDLAPFAFLPAPILFVTGGILFITAQLFADHIRDCPACTDWTEAERTESVTLQQCPRCGRWAKPGGAPWRAEDPAEERKHGFEVVMSPEDRREPHD